MPLARHTQPPWEDHRSPGSQAQAKGSSLEPKLNHPHEDHGEAVSRVRCRAELIQTHTAPLLPHSVSASDFLLKHHHGERALCCKVLLFEWLINGFTAAAEFSERRIVCTLSLGAFIKVPRHLHPPSCRELGIYTWKTFHLNCFNGF